MASVLAAAHHAYIGPDKAAREVAFEAMVELYDADDLLPSLLVLVDHPDPAVRAGVADVLPSADPDASADSASIHALLSLTQDEVARVRDFAATGLGLLDDVDSEEIRAALRRLLDEVDSDEAYPAAEAAHALAARQDPAVIEVIRRRLTDGVGVLWLEAATLCRSSHLLPALRSLTSPDEDLTDPWVVALHEAIDASSAPG